MVEQLTDSPAGGADFGADTAVSLGRDGSWGAWIRPEWSGPPGPNGGYVAALILRAIRAEVGDPTRRPRSLTVHYLRPLQDGEVAIDVTVERAGRSATTCTARLSQGGKVMCMSLCVLSAEFEVAASWRTQPPDAPAPEAVEPMDTAFLPPRIFDQLEMRMVFGAIPFTGAEEALAGGWVRTKRPGPLDPELLATYADSWWPAPFPRLEGPVLAPTLEMTIHFRLEPPPGVHEHVLARFRSTTGAEGFFEEDGELWSERGELLAQSRQLALLRPLPA